MAKQIAFANTMFHNTQCDLKHALSKLFTGPNNALINCPTLITITATYPGLNSSPNNESNGLPNKTMIKNNGNVPRIITAVECCAALASRVMSFCWNKLANCG